MKRGATLTAMRAVPLRLWLLSILSAVLQVLPFPIAGPVPIFRRVFCWFCLTPLLWALLYVPKDGKRLRPLQAAMIAYLAGVLWYLGNCYWIYPTMHAYGGIVSPVAFGILILFALYVGLYHALFGALVGWLHRTYCRQVVLWLVPFVWVGVELARARITGFPWDLLGTAQVDNITLTRLAPWTGVMGLSLVIALTNALWLIRIQVRSQILSRIALPAAAFMAVLLSFVFLRIVPVPAARTANALLLQENLKVGAETSQPAETRADLLRSFSGLTVAPAQSADAVPSPKPDIVLWPEAPNGFFDEDPAFRTAVGDLARQQDTPIVSNSITVAQRQSEDRPLQLFNSASFFTAAGEHVGRYNKMHLVPFGEYTPYKQLFFFAGHLLDNVGPFVPGTSRASFATNGHHYGVFICYESIFGDEIREFARSGADVLVNLSDDGWYGDSSAPWEHLDMVRMRAIENHRWVLRATNTGVTASIDPYGRIVATLPRHIRSSLLTGFGYSSDVTFYTRYGDWLGWLCAAVTVCALALGRFRHRQVH